MLLKDHWYIACPASQLSNTEPRAIQIGQEDLVVFRDGSGQAHALLDRCCHRGVKLSLGRISEGRLACGYHGWQYAGDGRLLHVPALDENDEIPKCSVPAYPTLEKDHYIWVWMAGEHASPTYEPAIYGLEDGGNWIQQTATWNVHIMDAVENQLDIAHTPFSHPGIYPGHQTTPGAVPPLNKAAVECRVDKRGVEVFGPPAQHETDPTPLWKDMIFWARYELPYRNYVFLTKEKVMAIYNWVPLAEAGHCRLEFMGLAPSRGDENASTDISVRYLEGELELLSQDRKLLESATQWIDQGRQTYERSVSTDFPQLQARRLQKAALEGNVNDGSLYEGKRKIFTVRA